MTPAQNQHPSPAIVVEQLTKTFGNVHAVDHISFIVHSGEILAFLGPNGAGKTTTIKMITTLLQPSSGNIIVEGFEVAKEQDKVRSCFGIVFQDQSLDEELTAYENMELHGILYALPATVRKERIASLLAFVELWERKDEFVKNFSGGMRRRLEIARSLLHHPRILFLDEPTLGLDPQTRSKFWEYVRKINAEEKMTVFFTTHYLEEAEKIAQRIAIIDGGKIAALGTVEELKKKTKTKSLEGAFLHLTGHALRDENANAMDRLRQVRKMWKR